MKDQLLKIGFVEFGTFLIYDMEFSTPNLCYTSKAELYIGEELIFIEPTIEQVEKLIEALQS
jgi:hypothetical protein